MSTTQKSPTELLREQMIAASKLTDRIYRCLDRRIRAIEKLLDDASTSESARNGCEERLVHILRALTDASNKAATYLIPKGTAPVEPPTATTVEDIIAELKGPSPR